jgi:hypothetical protein
MNLNRSRPSDSANFRAAKGRGTSCEDVHHAQAALPLLGRRVGNQQESFHDNADPFDFTESGFGPVRLERILLYEAVWPDRPQVSLEFVRRDAVLQAEEH